MSSRRSLRSAALVLWVVTLASYGWAQGRTVSLQLEPRKSQTLIVSLQPQQVAFVHLSLEGGIIGVKETSPDGSSRPLWLIDLGRGAKLVYVAGGSTPGNYTLEITSFEKKKIAEVSVEISRPGPASELSTKLRDAEDLLANAELIRRHWPTAPASMDAVDLYDRAFIIATELESIPLKRLILTQKARYFVFSRNRFAEANTLLEQAVALPSADDVPQQALAWKTLSSVRYDLGEYRPAVDAGISALTLYRQTRDLYWQGIVLGNLSSVYSEMGQTDDALAAAHEALEDAEQTRDTAGVVYCLGQLAGLYQQQGDLEGALRSYYQGLAWVSDINYAPLVEAEIQKNLGDFYAQIGNWQGAALALRRCIELAGKNNDPLSLEARGLLVLVMRHDGKVPEAIVEATNALEIARRASLKREEAGLLLKRASLHTMLRHPELAGADVKAARTISSSLNSLPLEIEVELATGDALLSGSQEAGVAYQNALQLAERAEEREEQAIALAGLARSWERQGRLEQANASIERALKIVEASRGGLASRKLQVAYFSLHRSWYELAVDICMRLHQQNPSEGYESRAFAYTERARARSLLDTFDASGYAATRRVPEQLREAFARNQREVSRQQELVAGGDGVGKAATKLQELYQEQQALEVQMEPVDGSPESMLRSQPVEVAQIQQKLLDDHSLLLSYWIGDKHSYRWSITTHGVFVEVLPPRSQLEHVILPVEGMLRKRRAAPKAGQDVNAYALDEGLYQSQLEVQLQRVGSILLRHIGKDVHTIFVVGDGCLASLPFAALRIADGTKASYAVSRYDFFTEPSASVAVYLKQNPAPQQALHITVFADPVFSRSDARLSAKHQQDAATPALFADLPRLAGSNQEALQVSRLAPAGTVTLRTGFDAAADEVRKLLPRDASILHFATHTVTVPDHSEITGIALSMLSRDGKEQNGIFWLKDIYSLRLPSSLVVLSGCETDRQNDHSEEALDSLAYAFFFAGARSVVGSLWAVDDSSTTQLVAAFYRELLLKHKTANEALRGAQLEMLANPQTNSPAVWASFVLEGWPEAYSVNRSVVNNTSIPNHRFIKEK